MTIASDISRVDLVGDGANDTFAFTFEIYAKTDLLVYVGGVLKTIDLHYTIPIASINNPDGGNVVFTVGNKPADGAIVSLILDLPFTQEIDYGEGDKFPAETHETGLDRAVKLLQQLREQISRQLILLSSSLYNDLTLPDPVGGNYLRWKADLTGLENVERGEDAALDPVIYGNAMTGDESFVDPGGDHLRCFLDPNGANRNFNPSGTFPSGFLLLIVNTGVEIITFDSTASAQSIGPGQLGTFLYDGSNWH
jgi:hypothetical protein